MQLTARLVFCLAIGTAAGASAFHDEPKRAKAVKAPLVTAYLPCTSPNTHTTGVPSFAACEPPLRVDELCGFTDPLYVSGLGKAAGQAKANGDFQIKVVVRGLNSGCEGRTMCPTVKIRATTHRCATGAACTTQDIELIGASPTACCKVMSGACSVSTTINSEVLGTLVPGDRTGVEIYGIGLRRVDGQDPPATSGFVSGILTP